MTTLHLPCRAPPKMRIRSHRSDKAPSPTLHNNSPGRSMRPADVISTRTPSLSYGTWPRADNCCKTSPDVVDGLTTKKGLKSWGKERGATYEAELIGPIPLEWTRWTLLAAELAAICQVEGETNDRVDSGTAAVGKASRRKRNLAPSNNLPMIVKMHALAME